MIPGLGAKVLFLRYIPYEVSKMIRGESERGTECTDTKRIISQGGAKGLDFNVQDCQYWKI
jgi:hypothetical protein